MTEIELNFIKDKELLLFLENNKPGGISSVMGDRPVVLDVNKEILYINANNLYAMSQYFLTGEFEKLPFDPNNYTYTEGGWRDNNLEQLVEDLLQIPDDFEYVNMDSLENVI